MDGCLWMMLDDVLSGFFNSIFLLAFALWAGVLDTHYT